MAAGGSEGLDRERSEVWRGNSGLLEGSKQGKWEREAERRKDTGRRVKEKGGGGDWRENRG